MSDYKHTVEAWIQLRPRWGSWKNAQGERTLTDVTLGRVTLKRPRQPEGGTIMVKVEFRVPARLFEPVRPVAVIELSEGEVEPVLIEAMPAGEPDA